MDRFISQLAAAADLPLPLLLGESPGGLNASGASGDQLRMHYDRCAALARRKVVPAIRRVAEIQLRAMGIKPQSWAIKPRPLWQLTGKEKAEERKIQADVDAAYIDRGVLTGEEVRQSRFGGDNYSTETVITKPEIGAAPDGALTTAAKPEPVTTVGVGGQEIQKTALNGTQITSLLDVVQLAARGAISRESGSAILQTAFQLSEAEAFKILGPKEFRPVIVVPETGGMPAPKS
jgi:hypothetical protein